MDGFWNRFFSGLSTDFGYLLGMFFLSEHLDFFMLIPLCGEIINFEVLRDNCLGITSFIFDVSRGPNVNCVSNDFRAILGTMLESCWLIVRCIFQGRTKKTREVGETTFRARTLARGITVPSYGQLALAKIGYRLVVKS